MATFGAVRGMLETMGIRGTVAVTTEQDLIELARQGDRAAFDRIVEAHLPRVWGVIWRILRHREDTEDVVQEAFLAAYRALPGFRGEAELSTWLHRIAVTRALNHLDRSAEKMRRASRPIEPSAGGEEPAFERPPGEVERVPSPLAALEAKELMGRLRECLSRLPAAWRAALALRDGEEMSYEAIAVALGIALGTVRSRLARARNALRRCVEGETT